VSGYFTLEERREIVVALLSGRLGMAELCRERQVSSTAVYAWRDCFRRASLAEKSRGLSGRGRAVPIRLSRLADVGMESNSQPRALSD